MSAKNGLLIHYEYCSGCNSCVVACKNELKGKQGITLLKNGPRELDGGKIEWDYLPMPTEGCNLCEDRVKAGKKPNCVHHCLSFCMEYGPLEDLTRSASEKGRKVVIFTTAHAQ